MSITITKNLKSVNNKELVRQITDSIDEMLNDLHLIWSSDVQRSSILELIEDELITIQANTKKIGQYKLVSDKRNNKVKDMENGIYHLDVYFKQTDCLNTTAILYTINTNGVSDSLDFDL